MTDEQTPTKQGWWHTLPGVLTAVAAVITAITGLVAVLIQIGVFSDGRNDAATQEANGAVDQETSTSSSPPGRGNGSSPPPAATIEHALVRRSKFQSPLAAAAQLYFYDVDAPAQLGTRTNVVDFFFKPDDPENPLTNVGVDPWNGAKYAPRSAGRLPWEVEAAAFTSSGGVYPITQGEDIPCYTSDRRPCTFQIRLEPPGEMAVFFALYR